MSSQSPCLNIARYLVSYSDPDSTLCISTNALSPKEDRISSFHESGTQRNRNMYPVTRGPGGIRNGFGRYRMANHEQPFHIDHDRTLNYPNDLRNSDGHPNPTPMSHTPGILQGAAAPMQDLFKTMSNDDYRRRSSSISPRTIRAPAYPTPYSTSVTLFEPEILTPPSSANFANRTAQAEVAVELNPQIFNRPSISTIRTSTATASTKTSITTHDRSQRAIFALLYGICTEALRRKWHEETQRQSIRSLSSRHPRLSRHHRRSHGRNSPYRRLFTVPNPYSHANRRILRTHAAAATAEQPLGFMDLLQHIATAIWENATRQEEEQEQRSADGRASASRLRMSGELETAAIDSMRILYSLGNSIMAATISARGESFSLDEIRDVVDVAASFCRVLGYTEGADRCEEVGRHSFGLVLEQGGR